MRRALDAKGIAMLLLLLMVAALVIYMVLPINNFAASSLERQSGAIERAITTAVLQCYALEGSYPPDLQYVSDHYGVILDYDNYYYQYEIFASNIRPSISVTPKLHEK